VHDVSAGETVAVRINPQRWLSFCQRFQLRSQNCAAQLSCAVAASSGIELRSLRSFLAWCNRYSVLEGGVGIVIAVVASSSCFVVL